MAQPQQTRSGYGLLVLLALLFAAVGIVALIVPTSSTLHDAALVLWGAVPVSVALWDFAYHRIERHRLLVNRVRFWATNPESTWGMTAEFTTALPLQEALDAADEVVQKLKGPADLRLSRAPGVSVWQIAGTTLRIVVDVASDPVTGDINILRVDFPAARRAFRAWRGVIEHTATLVVERVDAAISPVGRKFVVRLGFPEDNPYFALFVTNVGLQAVTHFDLDYLDHRFHETDVVRVKKDRMELITETMFAARALSLHYLALKEVPA